MRLSQWLPAVDGLPAFAAVDTHIVHSGARLVADGMLRFK
jgi:hypothetical protein